MVDALWVFVFTFGYSSVAYSINGIQMEHGLPPAVLDITFVKKLHYFLTVSFIAREGWVREKDGLYWADSTCNRLNDFSAIFNEPISLLCFDVSFYFWGCLM